jgi:hypothetical protein
MVQANQSKPAPKAWRDALQRAHAEVAAGQAVENEAIFVDIAADLDAMHADEPAQPDKPTAPPR